MWVFPNNNIGKKLKLDIKFHMNCIRLKDVTNNSIKLANRNGHMILVGDSKDFVADLGDYITFKILIIYNHINKRWIVSPFKMVSASNSGNICLIFSKVATTSDIERQFKLWQNGLEYEGLNLGLLNYKYLDDKFKNMPNLFSIDQTNELLIKAKKINLDTCEKIMKITETKYKAQMDIQKKQILIQ